MNLTYVFEHGDPVLIATFLLLVAMSVSSWYVMVWKALLLKKERQQLQQFKTNYMQHPDWTQHLSDVKAKGGVHILLQEALRHTPELEQATDEKRQQLLTVYLSQSLDTIRAWLDRGATLLASVGSSAPFIGLFGTVWGIYGALTDIAAKGSASLNVVAGPMGEALIATAIGLFAAIPAVLAYNAFTRSNRTYVQELRHIAEQLTLHYGAEKQPSQQQKQPLKLAAGE